ncbi:pyridoxamine 5'-phosphate oxidase family protein [Kiloniella sp. b19]|uniref:pyridoxamine 5'-phosphate oxidase family protein n=1 Tax=Kiloniella sp. GXU_MW_B19 TaxID=3141326 RepID=UPI0031D9A22E
MLNDLALSSIETSVLCWLATADSKGQASVSPKQIFCANGTESLLIANIASPHSRANIRQNRKVCVSMIDIFVQKGCKIYGEAKIHEKGSEGYERLVPPLLKLLEPGYLQIRDVIEVHPTSIKPLMAPSYHLSPEKREEETVRAEGYETYGVRPL